MKTFLNTKDHAYPKDGMTIFRFDNRTAPIEKREKKVIREKRKKGARV